MDGRCQNTEYDGYPYQRFTIGYNMGGLLGHARVAQRTKCEHGPGHIAQGSRW